MSHETVHGFCAVRSIFRVVSHRLNGKDRKTVFDGLQREVVLVAWRTAAIMPGFVEAYNVVDGIAVAWDGDDDGVWRRPAAGTRR